MSLTLASFACFVALGIVAGSQPDDLVRLKFVRPDDPAIQYFGRVGTSDPLAPTFHYGMSGFRLRFSGTSLGLTFLEDGYGEGNWVGIRIDGGTEIRQYLRPGITERHQIATGLKPGTHDAMVYRRSDAWRGSFSLKGLALDPDAQLLSPPDRPKRRIEFYGDSVTAGGGVEAVGYENLQDDQIRTSNEIGVLDNAYHSFASITSRALNAEANVNGIGGLALFDGTGYFNMPDTLGFESTYDKLDPIRGRQIPWDFTRFVPHVVVVAIGQNDAKGNDPKDPAQREKWIRRYVEILKDLNEKHPGAWFVLTTTILNHDLVWDSMISESALEARRATGHNRFRSFRFKRAGVGTPGHPRVAEQEEMARELTAFIKSLRVKW